ncbi:uncharacterized protein RCC_07143 [Ramularia collo-cygni]|uniref:Uncharacterized protein n=1 Tax=Ramularia collo-cygni TaxID=112498 RepID=A0A2D3V756_9PEZI|nr:uncharacterized protein RCC_07143 [Ramularia collo-cygni]CZT21280.1 uncharacterized protein RCC_07143 [Ramularia collo-cygni]
MASPSICTRCALRIQRASSSSSPTTTRSFSSTPSFKRAVPTFAETANPELNDILSTIRSKHFIPAYLRNRERRAIFGDKNRQNLIDNPQSVVLGDEEIQLQWINRRREIPNRNALITKAINLMLASETKDWGKNLPALLQGLNEGVKKSVDTALMEKVLRKAAEMGKLGTVLPCMQRASKTNMTLKNEAILRCVVLGLHASGARNGWNKGSLEKAIRDSNVVALMLESADHGTQSVMSENDPRTRPFVLGTWLELVAAYAYKYQGGKDSAEGVVKTYTARLLSRLAESGTEPPQITVLEKGMQWPILQAIPVWHGLYLAQKLLGNEMPNPNVAREALASYEGAISNAVSELEAQSPTVGSYPAQAVDAWKSCIRE